MHNKSRRLWPLLTLVLALAAGCSDDDASSGGGHCSEGTCPGSIAVTSQALRCAAGEFILELFFDGGTVDPAPEDLTYYELYVVHEPSGEEFTVRSNASSGRELGIEIIGMQIDPMMMSLDVEQGSEDVLRFTFQNAAMTERFGADFDGSQLKLREYTNGYKDDSGWSNFKNTSLDVRCE